MVKGKKDLEKNILRQIFDFFSCTSIISIDDTTIKYFSKNRTSRDRTIIVYQNRAFYYKDFEIDVNNKVIIIYYTVSLGLGFNLSNILREIRDSPVDYADLDTQKLINLVKQGYRITFRNAIKRI